MLFTLITVFVELGVKADAHGFMLCSSWSNIWATANKISISMFCNQTLTNLFYVLFSVWIQTRLSWHVCIVYSLLGNSVILRSCNHAIPIWTFIAFHRKVSSESHLVKLFRVYRTSNPRIVRNVRLTARVSSDTSLRLVRNSSWSVHLSHVMLVVTLSNIRFHTYSTDYSMRVFSRATFHFFLWF